MSSRFFSLVSPIAFALAAGCGSLVPAYDGVQVAPDHGAMHERIAPEVVLLDTAEAVHTLEIQSDRIIAWVNDGEAAPAEVGSILVGQTSGGYLREVVGVEVLGDQYTLHTVRTDLSRVFTDGSYDLELRQAALRSANEQFGVDWNFGGRVLVDQTLWSDQAGNNVQFSVVVADGAHLRLTPTVRTKADFFDGAVVDAGFQLEGALDYEADFVVRATGKIAHDVEQTVLQREVRFVEFVGPVPIVGTARVNVVAGVRGSFDANLATTLHTEAHGAVHMGAGLRNLDLWTQGGCGTAPEWGQEGVNTNLEDCFNYDIGFRDTTTELDIHAQGYVRTEIAFDLYDSAGAEVAIEPWAEAWTCNEVDGSPALGVDFDAGIRGHHSYHYSVLWGLLDDRLGPYSWGDSLRWDIYPSEPMTCGAL